LSLLGLNQAEQKANDCALAGTRLSHLEKISVNFFIHIF
jgi:hypothetical protein